MSEKAGVKILFRIFLTFFKIGCFTFGGGYAMIPLIEREVATKKKWIEEEEVVDIIAVSESIPGAIAINSATFIGYKIAGKAGALAAISGIVLPSFLIITLVAAFFSRFQENPAVKAAFTGIRSAVTALILLAAVKIFRMAVKDRIALLIFVCTVVLVLFFDIHALFTIILGAVSGLFLYVAVPGKAQQILGREKEDRDDIP